LLGDRPRKSEPRNAPGLDQDLTQAKAGPLLLGERRGELGFRNLVLCDRDLADRTSPHGSPYRQEWPWTKGSRRKPSAGAGTPLLVLLDEDRFAWILLVAFGLVRLV